jgi:hypothetical protein
MEEIIRESYIPIEISPVEKDFLTLNNYFSTAYRYYIQENLSNFDIDLQQALLSIFYEQI